MYKRQTLDTLPFAVVAEVMGIEVPGLSLEKVDDLRNMAYGAAVSYTHLDVYKRQVWD